jgi:FkbM family methyltransferase
LLNGIAITAAKMFSRSPRGGFFVARKLAALLPQLREAPLDTRYGRIYCDLSESVCYPLLKYGEYPHWRSDEEAIDRLEITEDTIVFDIGANIGILTRMFAARARWVHAFEPPSRALRLLRKNTSDLSNVTIHACAVADKPGYVYFHEASDCSMSGISQRSGNRVPATTIDALSIKPDFIKIDVEGFEHLVLKGASRTLQAGPIVMFEAMNECSRQYCEDIIRSANRSYSFETMGGGTNHIARTADPVRDVR